MKKIILCLMLVISSLSFSFNFESDETAFKRSLNYYGEGEEGTKGYMMLNKFLMHWQDYKGILSDDEIHEAYEYANKWSMYSSQNRFTRPKQPEYLSRANLLWDQVEGIVSGKYLELDLSEEKRIATNKMIKDRKEKKKLAIKLKKEKEKERLRKERLARRKKNEELISKAEKERTRKEIIKKNKEVDKNKLYNKINSEGKYLFTEMIKLCESLGSNFRSGITKELDKRIKAHEVDYKNYTSKYGKFIGDEKYKSLMAKMKKYNHKFRDEAIEKMRKKGYKDYSVASFYVDRKVDPKQ